MSAGRVSKLVAPSAGKRNVNNNNNNNGSGRPSPKRPAVVGGTNDGISATSKPSRVASSTARLPLAGGEDYVAVHYVNGQCRQTSSSSDADGHGRQRPEATSQQQQAILTSHLQVRHTVTRRVSSLMDH